MWYKLRRDEERESQIPFFPYFFLHDSVVLRHIRPFRDSIPSANPSREDGEGLDCEVQADKEGIVGVLIDRRRLVGPALGQLDHVAGLAGPPAGAGEPRAPGPGAGGCRRRASSSRRRRGKNESFW